VASRPITKAEEKRLSEKLEKIERNMEEIIALLKFRNTLNEMERKEKEGK
jgi:hypothetical protein